MAASLNWWEDEEQIAAYLQEREAPVETAQQSEVSRPTDVDLALSPELPEQALQEPTETATPWWQDTTQLAAYQEDLRSIGRAATSAGSVDARIQRGLVDEFSAGLSRGVDQTQALGYGLLGLMGESLGVEAVSDFGIEGYVRNMEEAAENMASVQDPFEEIGGVGDAGLYAAGVLGEQIPQLLLSLAGGGIGGYAAKTVAKKVVANEIAKRVTAGIAKEEAEEVVAKLVAQKALQGFATQAETQAIQQAATRGALGGAYVANVGQIAGGSFGEIEQETGQRDPVNALGFALLGGALETAGEAVLAAPIARRLIGSAARGIESQPLGINIGPRARVAGQLVATPTAEGLTERGQTFLEQAAVGAADPNRTIEEVTNTPEAQRERDIATVAGAVAGGGFGAVSQAASFLIPETAKAVQSKLAQRQAEQAPVTPAVDPQSGEALPVLDADWSEPRTSEDGVEFRVNGRGQVAIFNPDERLSPVVEGLPRFQTSQGQTYVPLFGTEYFIRRGDDNEYRTRSALASKGRALFGDDGQADAAPAPAARRQAPTKPAVETTLDDGPDLTPAAQAVGARAKFGGYEGSIAQDGARFLLRGDDGMEVEVPADGEVEVVPAIAPTRMAAAAIPAVQTPTITPTETVVAQPEPLPDLVTMGAEEISRAALARPEVGIIDRAAESPDEMDANAVSLLRDARTTLEESINEIESRDIDAETKSKLTTPLYEKFIKADDTLGKVPADATTQLDREIERKRQEAEQAKAERAKVAAQTVNRPPAQSAQFVNSLKQGDGVTIYLSGDRAPDALSFNGRFDRKRDDGTVVVTSEPDAEGKTQKLAFTPNEYNRIGMLRPAPPKESPVESAVKSVLGPKPTKAKAERVLGTPYTQGEAQPVFLDDGLYQNPGKTNKVPAVVRYFDKPGEPGVKEVVTFGQWNGNKRSTPFITVRQMSEGLDVPVPDSDLQNLPQGVQVEPRVMKNGQTANVVTKVEYQGNVYRRGDTAYDFSVNGRTTGPGGFREIYLNSPERLARSERARRGKETSKAKAGDTQSMLGGLDEADQFFVSDARARAAQFIDRRTDLDDEAKKMAADEADASIIEQIASRTKRGIPPVSDLALFKRFNNRMLDIFESNQENETEANVSRDVQEAARQISDELVADGRTPQEAKAAVDPIVARWQSYGSFSPIKTAMTKVQSAKKAAVRSGQNRRAAEADVAAGTVGQARRTMTPAERFNERTTDEAMAARERSARLTAEDRDLLRDFNAQEELSESDLQRVEDLLQYIQGNTPYDQIYPTQPAGSPTAARAGALPGQPGSTDRAGGQVAGRQPAGVGGVTESRGRGRNQAGRGRGRDGVGRTDGGQTGTVPGAAPVGSGRPGVGGTLNQRNASAARRAFLGSFIRNQDLVATLPEAVVERVYQVVSTTLDALAATRGRRVVAAVQPNMADLLGMSVRDLVAGYREEFTSYQANRERVDAIRTNAEQAVRTRLFEGPQAALLFIAQDQERPVFMRLIAQTMLNQAKRFGIDLNNIAMQVGIFRRQPPTGAQSGPAVRALVEEVEGAFNVTTPDGVETFEFGEGIGMTRKQAGKAARARAYDIVTGQTRTSWAGVLGVNPLAETAAERYSAVLNLDNWHEANDIGLTMLHEISHIFSETKFEGRENLNTVEKAAIKGLESFRVRMLKAVARANGLEVPSGNNPADLARLSRRVDDLSNPNVAGADADRRLAYLVSPNETARGLMESPDFLQLAIEVGLGDTRKRQNTVELTGPLAEAWNDMTELEAGRKVDPTSPLGRAFKDAWSATFGALEDATEGYVKPPVGANPLAQELAALNEAADFIEEQIASRGLDGTTAERDALLQEFMASRNMVQGAETTDAVVDEDAVEDPVTMSRAVQAAQDILERYEGMPSVVVEGGRPYSPIVRDLLRRRAAGENIPRAVIDQAINDNFPAQLVDVPRSLSDLPDRATIDAAIDRGQRESRVEVSSINPGEQVTIRQDVPAMTRKGVGVVTVKSDAGNSYEAAARITEPQFIVNEKASLRIAMGERKGPHIAIRGKWSANQSMPSDLETWTQVGYNPDRHSFYYDRATMQQVTGGSEAYQIGNTVFVKDVEYGDGRISNISYSRAVSSNKSRQALSNQGATNDRRNEPALQTSAEGMGSQGRGDQVQRQTLRPNAEPNPFVQDGVSAYNARYGLGEVVRGHYAPVDEQRARQIAAAYDALPVLDRGAATQEAYGQLAREIQQQWDYAINDMGITFEPWTQEGQPYANSREMVRDVRDNRHLWFFTGGEPHPLLNQPDADGLTMNDKLRAIHDLFGHAAEDYQFGARGEENAWIKHSQMFTPLAQRALTTETRGQNSWVNYGTHNYNPDGTRRSIPASERPFATQKVALLPEEYMDWQGALAQSPTESRALAVRAVAIDPVLVAGAIREAGGITVDIWNGVEPASGYIVAPYKETETRVSLNAFAPDDVRSFIRRFADLLSVPGMHLGGWISGETVYLDTSIVTNDQVLATLLAQDGNQLAVFDRANFIEIPTAELVGRLGGQLRSGRERASFQNFSRTLRETGDRVFAGIRGPGGGILSPEGALQRGAGLTTESRATAAPTNENRDPYFGNESSISRGPQEGGPDPSRPTGESQRIARSVYEAGGAIRDAALRVLEESGLVPRSSARLSETQIRTVSRFIATYLVAPETKLAAAKTPGERALADAVRSFREKVPLIPKARIEELITSEADPLAVLDTAVDRFESGIIPEDRFGRALGELARRYGVTIGSDLDEAVTTLRDYFEENPSAGATWVIEGQGAESKAYKDDNNVIYKVAPVREDLLSAAPIGRGSLTIADNQPPFFDRDGRMPIFDRLLAANNLPIHTPTEVAGFVDDGRIVIKQPYLEKAEPDAGDLVTRAKNSGIAVLPAQKEDPKFGGDINTAPLVFRIDGEPWLALDFNPRNSRMFNGKATPFDLIFRKLTDKDIATNKDVKQAVERLPLRPAQPEAPTESRARGRVWRPITKTTPTGGKISQGGMFSVDELLDKRAGDAYRDSRAQIRADVSRIQELSRNLERQMKSLYKGQTPPLETINTALGNLENPLTSQQLDEIERLRANRRPKQAELKRTQYLRENRKRFKEVTQPEALAQLPEDLADTIREMSSHIESLSRRLPQEGLVNGDLAVTIDEALGTYLNRSYAIFDDPKWTDTVRKNAKVMDAARKYIRNSLVQSKVVDLIDDAKTEGRTLSKDEAASLANDSVTDDQVEGLLESYLAIGDEAPTVEILSGRIPGQKNLSMLNRRGNIAPEIQALWGRYEDPTVNYAKTVMKLSSLVANNQFLTELRDMGLEEGWLWSRENNPDDDRQPPGYVRISSDNNPTLAPIAGMYAHPMLAEGLFKMFPVGSTEEHYWWLRSAMKLTGVSMGMKTVGSVASQIRNYLGNYLNLIAGGNLGLGDIASGDFARRFQNSTDLVLANTFNKYRNATRAEWRAKIDDYIRRGIVGESITTGLLEDLLTASRRAGSPDWGDYVWDKVSTPFKKVTDFATRTYSAGDDWFKVMIYEAEQDKYRKAYPEWDDEKVKQRAAEIARDIHWTYSLAPAVVQDLKKFPFVAPFVTFTTEVIRTTYNTMKLAREEIMEGRDTGNKELEKIGWKRVRGMATAAFLPAAVGSASMALAGISGDDEEDLRRFLPDWQKNSQLLLFRKDNGEVSFVDISFLDPYEYFKKPLVAFTRSLRNADSADEILLGGTMSMVRQALDPFTSEQIFAGAIMDVMRNTDAAGRQVYNPQDTGSNIGAAVARKIFIDPFTPGTFNSLDRIGKAAFGIQSESGRAYDLFNELSSVMLGQRVSQMDAQQALQFKGSRFMREIRDASALFNREFVAQGTRSVSDIVSGYERSNAARRALIESIRSDYNAAIRLGVPVQRAKAILRDAGLGKDTLKMVTTGIYKPFDASQQSLDLVRSRGNTDRIAAYNQAKRNAPTREVLP